MPLPTPNSTQPQTFCWNQGRGMTCGLLLGACDAVISRADALGAYASSGRLASLISLDEAWRLTTDGSRLTASFHNIASVSVHRPSLSTPPRRADTYRLRSSGRCRGAHSDQRLLSDCMTGPDDDGKKQQRGKEENYHVRDGMYRRSHR